MVTVEDLKAVHDFLCTGSSSNVQEVCWLSSIQFDDVHCCHCQTCSIHCIVHTYIHVKQSIINTISCDVACSSNNVRGWTCGSKNHYGHIDNECNFTSRMTMKIGFANFYPRRTCAVRVGYGSWVYLSAVTASTCF